jgi:hypothetical protein
MQAVTESWHHALHGHSETYGAHSLRIGQMAMTMGQALGFRGMPLETLRCGALLHDVGKVAIAEAILHKPGPLDEHEWLVMQQHPQLAFSILAPFAATPGMSSVFQPLLTIARHHHEKWDGSGYPDGLSGEDIPLAARIVAIIDVWDALQSDRPYRAPWSEADAHAHIVLQAGTQFDPLLAGVFEAVYNNQTPLPVPSSGTLRRGDLQRLLLFFKKKQATTRLLLVKPAGDHAVLIIYKGCVRDVWVWHRNLHDRCCQGDAALRTVATWSQARYWIEPEQPSATPNRLLNRIRQHIAATAAGGEITQ